MVLSIQHRLIPPTANTKVIEDDDADRRRDGRGAAVGARAVTVEQLRLRRSQRLDHHRPRLNSRSHADDDEHQVALGGDLAVQRARGRCPCRPAPTSCPSRTRGSARHPARPDGGSGRCRSRRTAAACPAKRSSRSTANAPTWAIASHISTPGSVGRPGKWPAKNHSSPVNRQRPRADYAGDDLEDLVDEEERRPVREHVGGVHVATVGDTHASTGRARCARLTVCARSRTITRRCKFSAISESSSRNFRQLDNGYHTECYCPH